MSGFHRFFNRNRARNRGAYHRVVAHADEAHHLDVSGNGRGARKLRVGVHTSHGVGHAVAGRTCRHVVGVKRSAGAAARRDREVLDAVFIAPFLVGAGDRVLESRRVGGVAGDGNADVFELHDGHALGNVVRAVALDVRSRTVGVGLLIHDLYLLGEGVELGLDVGEAVDPRNDERGVLAEAVQDNAEGLGPYLVGVKGDLDSALCGGKALVAGKEAEALGALGKKHGGEIAVAEADLAVFGDRAGDAEALEALADGYGRVGSLLAALLDGDGAAHGVGPDGVFKAYRLGLADDLVAVDALGKGDLFTFLDRGDTVFSENRIDLVYSSLIVFK